jgi:mRNA-degrading endonuclease RelE of RelBE toxin-antitoxin system
VAYTFEYSKDAIEHIRKLPADRRAAVMDQLEERLAHQPTVPARNRKPMDPDKKLYVAPWELRLGDLRVYYAVEDEPKKVIVVAVGIKEREKLFIGGKEVES